MTDEEIKNWENPNIDFGDEMYRHFEQWGRWDWCEIAEEARRIHNVAFDETVEEYSAIDSIVSAAVAHANYVAYKAMAAAIGVNAKDLRLTISPWAESQDNPLPPIRVDQLIALIEKDRKDFNAAMQEASQ